MDKYLAEAKDARNTLMQEAEEASRRYMDALKNFMHEGEEMLKRFNDAIVEANTNVETMAEVRMTQWRGGTPAKETENKNFIPVTSDEDASIKGMAEKLAPHSS